MISGDGNVLISIVSELSESLEDNDRYRCVESLMHWKKDTERLEVTMLIMSNTRLSMKARGLISTFKKTFSPAAAVQKS